MEIKAVLFDFGGVIAEEGFYQGLREIGARNDLDPEQFFRQADRIIYDSGYLTGRADEASFWNAVRKATGIMGTDTELRGIILERFVLRPDMLAEVDRIRQTGRTVGMLSDQTNWLEEIDSRSDFLGRFDRVFNSFRMHKSKRDATVFLDVCGKLCRRPAEVLFVDDNPGHVERARMQGLRTILFTTPAEYLRQVDAFLRG